VFLKYMATLYTGDKIFIQSLNIKTCRIPYILESTPYPNLIRTSFCRFLKRKKKLVRGSNKHLWEDDGEDKDDSDWVTDNDSVMGDDGESDE